MSMDWEVLWVRSCSGIEGGSEPLQIGRRNSRAVPLMHPKWISPDFLQQQPAEEIDVALLENICRNLSPLERQTWLSILDGRSIPDIARDHGVTHVAVYERIRGKKGHGGMIRKNPYVRRWWEVRQRRRKQA